MFEHQRAAIPYALAIEQGHMTTEDAAGDTKQRDGLADLHFDTHAGQETPVGFDERTARRQVDDGRGASGTQARPLHPCQCERGYPRPHAPIVP
jgi:hypothetical protein